MILFNENFRTINCNCWNPKVRLNEMEKTEIDLQVISPIPIMFSYWADAKDALEQSQLINDFISDVCIKHPKRFVGLGTIPMQSIDYSIKELERCKNDLNLQGIEIGTNINDQNLNEEKFFDIFAACEELSMSIFIHPWQMMGMSKMKKYWLPWLVGMPAETSRAICSLIFGGVLEKYPNLKIAFAHGGGAFPFTAGRVDHGFNVRPDLCAVDNSALPSSYMKNFYVDSLVHDKNSMNFILQTMGAERIAMGSDYPFPLGEHHPGNLIESMDLSDATKQRLLAGTALEWLGINKSEFA